MSNKKVAVLDIASDLITLVVQDSKFVDSYTFRASREYDGFYDGEFLDKEGFFKVIASLVNECEKATFTKIQDVLVGVPGEFTAVTCRDVAIDLGSKRKVTEKDEERILKEGEPKGSAYTCITASAVYFELDDGSMEISPSGRETQILKSLVSYITCDNSFINLLNGVAEQLGLRFNYTSSVNAELLYVCPDSLRDEGVILADVGYTTTSVAYGCGDGILHALSFSLGSGHIAADLLECLGLPYEHAYALVDKINLNIAPGEDDTYCVSAGSGMAYYKVKEVNEVASYRISNIAEMILKAINLSPYPVADDTILLLTGSGIAHIPGAKEIVAKMTGKQVEILTPDIMQLNKPKYSQVAGLLVVQQMQLKQKKNFNLMNFIKDKLSWRK
ncbi:MAG: hypothetical protein IKB56_00095 [Clostridia bacterium]|nr:hypothetical protein [Clostridia bacterium]